VTKYFFFVQQECSILNLFNKNQLASLNQPKGAKIILNILLACNFDKNLYRPALFSDHGSKGGFHNLEMLKRQHFYWALN
jgi:hypothetical protein